MNNYSVATPANLAPSGIATFAKCPICTDIKMLDADIAILGAPCDISIQGRPGTRLGPRGIRVASTRFSYKEGGSYDPERDTHYLDTNLWKIFDCGDIDYSPGILDITFQNITSAISILAEKNIFPVILGGDSSITYPILKGLCGKGKGKINVIHFDAHLDWTESIASQRQSNGSPMRNAAALQDIGEIMHIGIRGIGSSKPSDFEAARNHGDEIYSPKQTREKGIKNILKSFEKDSNVYITFDIDVMDASLAPATGSPMFGGFNYDEMVDIFAAIAEHTTVIGFDMVEVSPPYDDNGETTAYLAARLTSDLLGFVTKKQEILGNKK